MTTRLRRRQFQDLRAGHSWYPTSLRNGNPELQRLTETDSTRWVLRGERPSRPAIWGIARKMPSRAPEGASWDRRRPRRPSHSAFLPPVLDVPRRLVRHLAAEEGLDDVEGHVHPGGHAGRGDDAVVDHPGGAFHGDAGIERARRSREAQWVVARRPSRRPALASRREPVQTEVTWRAAAAVRRIQSRVSSSLSSRRVPNPPGTTRRSIRGASAKPWRGGTGGPPGGGVGGGGVGPPERPDRGP